MSRGAGPRGVLPPDPAAPFVLMAIAPRTPPPAVLRLVLSDVVRPAHSLTSHHKTLSCIDNVEARRRAALAGFDEAVMLNEAGAPACATAANLFWITNGALHTPSLECGVLPGVTRARVLRLAAEQGADVREGVFDLRALQDAQAMFLTNSVAGVVAVESLTLPDRRADLDTAHPLLVALRRAEAEN